MVRNWSVVCAPRLVQVYSSFAWCGLNRHCHFGRPKSSSESVVIIPPHGVQLETHRGILSFCLFTNRRFIRADTLQDMVINEALRRWDVRFYLVGIQIRSPRNFIFNVAFEV